MPEGLLLGKIKNLSFSEFIFPMEKTRKIVMVSGVLSGSVEVVSNWNSYLYLLVSDTVDKSDFLVYFLVRHICTGRDQCLLWG